jgi:hypothetical protein
VRSPGTVVGLKGRDKALLSQIFSYLSFGGTVEVAHEDDG